MCLDSFNSTLSSQLASRSTKPSHMSLIPATSRIHARPLSTTVGFSRSMVGKGNLEKTVRAVLISSPLCWICALLSMRSQVICIIRQASRPSLVLTCRRVGPGSSKTRKSPSSRSDVPDHHLQYP